MSNLNFYTWVMLIYYNHVHVHAIICRIDNIIGCTKMFNLLTCINSSHIIVHICDVHLPSMPPKHSQVSGITKLPGGHESGGHSHEHVSVFHSCSPLHRSIDLHTQEHVWLFHCLLEPQSWTERHSHEQVLLFHTLLALHVWVIRQSQQHVWLFHCWLALHVSSVELHSHLHVSRFHCFLVGHGALATHSHLLLMVSW